MPFWVDWQIRESRCRHSVLCQASVQVPSFGVHMRNRGWEEAQPWGAAPGWESVLRNLVFWCVVSLSVWCYPFGAALLLGVKTKDTPEGWHKQIRNDASYAKRPNNLQPRKTAKGPDPSFAHAPPPLRRLYLVASLKARVAALAAAFNWAGSLACRSGRTR